jgi:hypothetical protein
LLSASNLLGYTFACTYCHTSLLQRERNRVATGALLPHVMQLRAAQRYNRCMYVERLCYTYCFCLIKLGSFSRVLFGLIPSIAGEGRG